MINIEPYSYQRVGYYFLQDCKWGIIADEMGLGKTLQAIMIIADERKKTRVVCPASMMMTWKNECLKFIKGIKESDVQLARKTDEECWIKIYSYAEIGRKMDQFEGSDVIVFDEAHYLKNPKSKRTLAAVEAAKLNPEFLILLTGTPIPNSAVDIYSLLSIVFRGGNNLEKDVNYLYPTFESFGDFFCYKKIFSRGSKFGRAVKQITYTGFRPETKSYLKTLLDGKYIRRKAKNVLELPPLTFKDIYLDNTAEETEVEAYEQFLVEENKTPHMMKLKADIAYKTAINTAKYAKELFVDHKRREPVIIYTDHLKSLIQLHVLLKDVGSIGRIEGKTSIENRQIIVDKFQGGDVDFLLCTIGAAAEGLTLTKGRNIIFNDLPWTPKDYEQVIKRIHRIGQNNKCVIHRILYSKSSVMMAKMLDTKISHICVALN